MGTQCAFRDGIVRAGAVYGRVNMCDSMRQYLWGRIELAERLFREVPGGTYADAILITTAVLSACASHRWPGKHGDRKRFVEMLVRHSTWYRTEWVSVPALINSGFIDEGDTPYGEPGKSCRIYCDDEIDLSFEDARRMYPHVPLKALVAHCYASLIYEWLRCGYAHEYVPHENITHVPASRRQARVSYIGRSVDGKTQRMVSFHLDYLVSLAKHHVSILPDEKCERPLKWWIEQESTSE